MSEELQWYQKIFFRINLLHCSRCPEFPIFFFLNTRLIPGPQIDKGQNYFKFEKINSRYTRTYSCRKYSTGWCLQMLGRIHLSQSWLKSLPRLVITVSLKSNCNTWNCLPNQYLTECFSSLTHRVPGCLPQTSGWSVLYLRSPVPKEQSQEVVKVSEKA